jgi:hypothetical protein
MYEWGDSREGGEGGLPSFDAISIMLAMVLECFVCDERSGLCRVYVKYGTNVYKLKSKIGGQLKV